MVAGKRRGAFAGLLALAVLTVSEIEAPPLADADSPVIARVAQLSGRVADTGSGATRISSASVRQEIVGKRAQATVTLDAAPAGATGATLVVAFGPIEDGICELNDILDANSYSTAIGGSPAAGWSLNGRTYRLDIADDAAGYQPWDCAGAIVVVGGENVSFLGGNLKEIHLKPRLRIDTPRILERKVKGALRLVRGAPHVVRVPVVGLNQADANRVVVSGKGRGLKVGSAKVGTVYGDSDRLAKLTVRTSGTRVGPLVIKVRSRNAGTVTRKIRIALRRPPARPIPGRYRSSDGNVDFRVTAGRRPQVKGFRIHAQTRCGGYGEFPIYTWNYYNFPARAIGGGGVLDVSQRRPLYGVSLGLRAIGNRVTEGRFSYGNFEAPCSAFESFTARRIGR